VIVRVHVEVPPLLDQFGMIRLLWVILDRAGLSCLPLDVRFDLKAT
jgi:hypothetical protein